MKGITKVLGLQLSLALAFAPLMGSAVQAQSKSGLEKTNLTVGTLTSAEFLPEFVAEDLGYFKDEGLTVTAPSFQAGTDVTQALLAGGVDIGAGGGTDALLGLAAGRPIRVIWELNNFVTFSYVAQPAIKSWAQMKGKTMAISSPGSETDLTLRWVLKKQAVDADLMRIVSAGSPLARLAALKNGTADAAVLTEPQGTQAANAGFSVLTRLSRYVPEWPSEVFFCSQAFIKQNPETIKAFLRAIHRAAKYIPTHEEESVHIMMQDMKFPEADAKIAFQLQKNSYPMFGDFGIPGWDFAQELMLSSDSMKQKIPYDKVFDYQFINWAKKTLN